MSKLVLTLLMFVFVGAALNGCGCAVATVDDAAADGATGDAAAH